MEREQNKVLLLSLPSRKNTAGSENTDIRQSIEVRKRAAGPGRPTKATPLRTSKAVSQDFQSRLERNVAFCGNQ